MTLPKMNQNLGFANTVVAWFRIDKILSLIILIGTALLFGNIWHLAVRILGSTFFPLPNVSRSVFEPVQLFGIILVCTAAAIKAAIAKRPFIRNRIEGESNFFKSYSGLTVPERQLRFESLYGAQPAANTIDALATHPTDPLGMARIFSRSGNHLKQEGSWFVLSSRLHSKKLWTWTVLCFSASLLTLASLTAGLWMTLSSQPPFPDLISGPTALLEALVVALGTNALIQDLRSYAQAYHLIAARPSAS
ncbi:hypothetical protein RLEG3_06570 (plasmid) [Rhizobium leguminosarum bv. trifolii WSM1689]|uniref:hypothetical protein n=1 Tax=Rhizobium leguminosarum TaxID=384 RepID=UPI0003E0AA28|nr:hypothetical protein [Rhizobium leguminosarum]AHF87927.1 hypothetical protein RLEG3_06570 [Rhizobium leguminosarum bv. trifolii WSM1689]